MKRVFVRFSAYIFAGAFLGAAAWLALLSVFTAAKLPVAIIALLSLIGVLVAILSLRSISAVSSNGIRINRAWSVVAMDSVCIIAATITSLFIIDGYEIMFITPPLVMSDPIALGVVAVMYVPSALVLAIFVTSSGSQVIEIDAEGVAIVGTFGKERAGWSDIEGLSPHEQYVVVSRVGIPIPRHLRTNMEIMNFNGDVLTVYQPELKSTAKVILQRLKQHAPHRLHKNLNEMEASWL